MHREKWIFNSNRPVDKSESRYCIRAAAISIKTPTFGLCPSGGLLLNHLIF